jgi:hypothetical protein
MPAETLLEYEAPLTDRDGNVYLAKACGREREDGTWEGWLEFTAIEGPNADEVWRTGRETTQPNRTDLVYWASGLSSVFLDGALKRAMMPPVHVVARAPEPPAFDGPAEDVVVVETGAVPPVDAVLDPYAAYAKGEAFLRRQLGALDAWHLRNIARAYHIVASPADADELGAAELIEVIVAKVREVAVERTTGETETRRVIRRRPAQGA